MSHLLSRIPYEVVERDEVVIPPQSPSHGYERPPRNLENYVPDVASALLDES
jgi:hypothetical protein